MGGTVTPVTAASQQENERINQLTRRGLTLNVVERAVAECYRRVAAANGPPGDADQLALGTALLVLRGGKAPERVIEAEMAAWVAEHGPPDRDGLDRWASGLDVEAGIAERALRCLHPGRGPQASG